MRAVVEGDLDLDGGVAARVEDLARADGLDAGHGGRLARLRSRRSRLAARAVRRESAAPARRGLGVSGSRRAGPPRGARRSRRAAAPPGRRPAATASRTTANSQLRRVSTVVGSSPARTSQAAARPAARAPARPPAPAPAAPAGRRPPRTCGRFSAALISSQPPRPRRRRAASASPNTCGWRRTSLSTRSPATSSTSNRGRRRRSAATRAWKTTCSSRSPSSSRSAPGRRLDRLEDLVRLLEQVPRSDACVCSASHGQPPGERSRSITSTARSSSAAPRSF